MKRKTSISSKRPDQPRRGGQRSNGTADGHDKHDSNHGISTASAPNGLVEDLHVGKPQGARRTFENGVDVGSYEEDSDNNGETECAVKEGGEEHGPGDSLVGVGDFFGHLWLGKFEGEWGRMKRCLRGRQRRILSFVCQSGWSKSRERLKRNGLPNMEKTVPIKPTKKDKPWVGHMPPF